MEDLVVSRVEAGLSALDLLQRRFAAAPAGYLGQLLRSGRVLRNGAPVAAACRLEAGDRIGLPGSRRLAEFAGPAGAVEILTETREALILNKPAGLAVHAGVGHRDDNLTARAQGLLAARRQRFACAPVHRLDRDTSGPVLFAKGRRATAAFGQLFMAGRVTKRYLALVTGVLPEAGLLEAPVPVRGRLRDAATRFRRLARAPGFCLVDLDLVTGRTHQIRRQLAAAGHPVAGDRRYGGAAAPGLERLFLHSRLLALPDPFGPGSLGAVSVLPPELAAVLQALGLEHPAEIADPAGFPAP